MTASTGGPAHGAHRRVPLGRLLLPAPLMALIGMFFQDGPPRAAPLTVPIGVFIRGDFACRLRSWRSVTGSSRTASPGSAVHGAHRHVLPGRLHLPAPLMALVGAFFQDAPPLAAPLMVLIGISRAASWPAPLMALGSMSFQDGLLWQRFSWCASAVSSRAALPAGSAHGAHRHVLPGWPLGRRLSLSSSACFPGQPHSPADSDRGAQQHVLPGRPPLSAPLTVLIGVFFQATSPGVSAQGARQHVLPGRLPLASPLMMIIGVVFQDNFTCRLRSWRSAVCSPRAASPVSAAHGAHRRALPGRLHPPAVRVQDRAQGLAAATAPLGRDGLVGGRCCRVHGEPPRGHDPPPLLVG